MIAGQVFVHARQHARRVQDWKHGQEMDLPMPHHAFEHLVKMLDQFIPAGSLQMKGLPGRQVTCQLGLELLAPATRQVRDVCLHARFHLLHLLRRHLGGVRNLRLEGVTVDQDRARLAGERVDLHGAADARADDVPAEAAPQRQRRPGLVHSITRPVQFGVFGVFPLNRKASMVIHIFRVLGGWGGTSASSPASFFPQMAHHFTIFTGELTF